MAQLWKLPVLYGCENNLYNEYTHFSETTAGDILARGTAFGLHAESVDGQDVRAVHQTASRLVDRGRKGEGPSFLLCNTYRYHGHHVGDINREYYRPKNEEQEWKSERDPILNLGKWLLENGHANASMLEQTGSETRSEIEAAVKFAIEAAYPAASEVDEDVYA